MNNKQLLRAIDTAESRAKVRELDRLQAQVGQQLILLANFVTISRDLILYRDRAGAVGFQLEKADDLINQLREVLGKVEAAQ